MGLKADVGRGKEGRWEDEKVSRAQSAWGIGLKADVGRRPPASPSCRLYLRAGSRRGRAYAPEGRWKRRKLGRWEDEKVGKNRD